MLPGTLRSSFQRWRQEGLESLHLNILSERYLLDMQGEVSSWKLEIQVFYSGEQSGLKIEMWVLSVLICSIPIKHLKNMLDFKSYKSHF